MTENTPSPETLALVAAAVAVTIEGPHHLLSVQQLLVPQDTTLYILNPWSMEGRFEIFRSHHLR